MINKEEIINFGKDFNLNGVFTPSSLNGDNSNTCVCFLNAGLIHNIGPNRLHVKLAREISKIGFSSFRFDFSGLGDSEISAAKQEQSKIKTTELNEALSIIRQRKNIEKFVLFGICSGAEDAYYSCLYLSEKIVGLMLIDGIYVSKARQHQLHAKYTNKNRWRYYKKYLFSIKRWMNFLSGKSEIFSHISIPSLIGKLKKSNNLTKNDQEHNLLPDTNDKSIYNWADIVEKDIKINLVFCEGGIAIDLYHLTIHDHLNYTIQSNQIEYKFFKNVDHTFTPAWTQSYLQQHLISWLQSNFCN